MNAIDRDDTEKKIAEIRKSVEEARKTDKSWVDGQDYADDVQFLLDELERLEREYDEERAAHNAHVTELSQERDAYYNNARYTEAAFHEVTSLRSQLQSAQQEIERLRQLYEREREIADRALEQVKNLREERNQDRQWIEKASENVTQLQQERDKLIEGLRWYAKLNPAYTGHRAREILEELGVDVNEK